jgi:pyridoxine/pyridoxamine 5'-phosphate oxidase
MEDHAREILDANLYMTLGTADPTGRPWVSPVYYASADYTDFYWVSKPEATHSRNLATRPEASIVVFDSGVPIGTGRAVYMSVVAAEVTGLEMERGIEIFSRTSQRHGGSAWALADVRPPARLRLYRATASDWWALDENDRRVPVDPRH